MKETQADFGLLDQAAAAASAERSLETTEDEAQPYRNEAAPRPLYVGIAEFNSGAEAWAVRDGSKGIRFLFDPSTGRSQPLLPDVEFVSAGGCAPPVGAAAAPKGLPTDAKARKQVPIYSGFVKYFPRAISAVAALSFKGNEQHHPGTPLHWDKSKSQDHQDALCRHMVDDAMGVPVDTDDVLHKTKVAWRAMADLEIALEKQAKAANPPLTDCTSKGKP